MIQQITKKLKEELIDFKKIIFLAGDASERKYFLIYENDQPNVLMVDKNSNNLKRFTHLSCLLKKYVSVPEIYTNLFSSDMLIIENFGDFKYSKILDSLDKKKIYEVAIDALVFVQKENPECNLDLYDKANFYKESNLFFDWYVKKKLVEKNKIKFVFNKIFDNFLTKIEKLPFVFVHRDYHIDNLFYLPNRSDHFKCGWIDFQDAIKGPCAYDLVSLTQDARVDVGSDLEDHLINYYLDKFKFIDKDFFLFSYKVIAIQRHLKVLGIFSRLAIRDKKRNYLKFIPRVLRMLNKNLKFPEFQQLHKILKPLLDE